MFRLWPFIVCWAGLWLLPQVAGQATVTVFETRTVTDIVTLSRDFVCAKIVNVTGTCRRRRGFKLDEPIILTFDDELNERIDAELNQIDQFSSPTATLSVETTPLPSLDEVAQSSTSTNVSPMSSDVIESSVPLVRTERATRRYGPVLMASSPASPRIYFAEINAFFNGLISQVLGLRSTVTVTATNVLTVTSTFTTGTSTSFFVMSCTPSPFPYAVCPARRR